MKKPCLLGLFAAACFRTEPGPVVATIYPLAAIAGEIAGESVQVKGIVPPSADPHSFEPSPADAALLAGAGVVIYAGPVMEPWVKESVGDRKDVVLVDASVSGKMEGNDPHVWLDPARAKMIASDVEKALSTRWPQDSLEFRANLARFEERVDSFDAWFRARLDSVPERRFVSVHPAWNYFAARYGLVEVASLNQTHGGETSPLDLARVVRLMNSQDVRAVFGSAREEYPGVSVLEREAQARVARLDPIGDEGDPERSDYVGLLFYNARLMLGVLK